MSRATDTPGVGSITFFAWGHRGWGSATQELVDAAAAVERARVIDDNYFCRSATTTPAGPEPS